MVRSSYECDASTPFSSMFKPAPQPPPEEQGTLLDADAAPALDYDTMRTNADRRVQELAHQFNLPPRPQLQCKRGRGTPSHQSIWLEGLYLVFDDVGMGKARLPPAHLITTEASAVLRKKHGFNAQMPVVRQHLHCAPDGATNDELYVADGVAEVDENAAESEKAKRQRLSQRKKYSADEMELFEDLKAIHSQAGKSLNAVIGKLIAKAQLPSIFLARTKYVAPSLPK